VGGSGARKLIRSPIEPYGIALTAALPPGKKSVRSAVPPVLIGLSLDGDAEMYGGDLFRLSRAGSLEVARDPDAGEQ
jgi:hypothetical protein